MQAFLTFSHQLYPAVMKQPRHTVVFLLEDARMFRPRAHPATAVFHRAALQAFRERLLVKGFPVRYMGADEYPTLEAALEAIAIEHPEVVRSFGDGTTPLEKQVEACLKRVQVPQQLLPAPSASVSTPKQASYVPVFFPPIEPNRYVEDAITYVQGLLGNVGELPFAYPVTTGDAEEWLDSVGALLLQGTPPALLGKELLPLIAAGLIQFPELETALTEASITEPTRLALHRSLALR